MRATYKVRAPRGRSGRFPDRCVVCGKQHPGGRLMLSSHAFEWWMALVWWAAALGWMKGAQHAVPACTGCARAFMRRYRLRLALEWAAVLAASGLAAWLVWNVPWPWRKWAGIGAAIIILIPFMLWKVLWPMAVEIDADNSGIEYQFTDPEYAEEFRLVNMPREARPGEPPAAEALAAAAGEGQPGPGGAGVPGGADDAPAGASAEDARLAALFDEGRLDAVISIVENRLRGIQPATPFHAVFGRDFLHQVESAADWLAGFHDACAREFRPAAIYVEMNRFDINFDAWYVEAMGHMEAPRGPMNEAEYDGDVSAQFVLTGMEDIQRAMEAFRERQKRTGYDQVPQHLRDAQGDAFFLVMLHMQNLVKRAAALCRRRGHPAGRIPVAANVHDETMVFTAAVESDDLSALAAARGASAPPPKYVSRPEYGLKYPDNWRVDVEDTYHDIAGRLTLVGPSGAVVRLELYDEEALHSPDEDTRDIAKIIWEREGVVPPTDARLRARKLVKDLTITGASAQRFHEWGRCHGEGIRITGLLAARPGAAAVFTTRAGPRWLVVTETCLDDDLSRSAPGLEMIRSTLRLGKRG